MLSCREVVKDADHLLDGGLGWRQRLAIRVHLLICHHCRRYVRQLRMLIFAIPYMHQPASDEDVARIMAAIASGEKPGA